MGGPALKELHSVLEENRSNCFQFKICVLYLDTKYFTDVKFFLIYYDTHTSLHTCKDFIVQ